MTTLTNLILAQATNPQPAPNYTLEGAVILFLMAAATQLPKLIGAVTLVIEAQAAKMKASTEEGVKELNVFKDLTAKVDTLTAQVGTLTGENDQLRKEILRTQKERDEIRDKMQCEIDELKKKVEPILPATPPAPEASQPASE